MILLGKTFEDTQWRKVKIRSPVCLERVYWGGNPLPNPLPGFLANWWEATTHSAVRRGSAEVILLGGVLNMCQCQCASALQCASVLNMCQAQNSIPSESWWEDTTHSPISSLSEEGLLR